MSKIVPEAWNHGTDRQQLREEEASGDCVKEGEGISQRTYEGFVDMDKGRGIDYGSEGQAGWRGVKGAKLRQL